MTTLPDSGKRQAFDTGSLRDTNDGKPRYDLISPIALKLLALHMARGAVKYGERNWELGQPVSRFYESALRHLMAVAEEEEKAAENHLAAVLYNVMGILHTLVQIERGKLSDELNDTEWGKNDVYLR